MRSVETENRLFFILLLLLCFVIDVAITVSFSNITDKFVCRTRIYQSFCFVICRSLRPRWDESDPFHKFRDLCQRHQVLKQPFEKKVLITFLCKCYVYVHLYLIILPVTFFQPAARWKLPARNSTMESLRVARKRLSQRSVYQKRHRRWSPVFHCHWVSSATVNISSTQCPLVGEYLPARRSVGKVY